MLYKIKWQKKKKKCFRGFFDLEKWATYFAIIDLSNGKHGAISKS